MFSARYSARVSGSLPLTGLVAVCLFIFCWRFVPALSDSPPSSSNLTKATKTADNSACSVCHQDFDAEALSTKHREAGVACIDCHGPSVDHASDELNIMLPDVMFGRKEIEPYCSQCHQKQDHPTGDQYQSFLNEWLGKYRPNGRVIRKTSICTDCHGNHVILTVDQLSAFPR